MPTPSGSIFFNSALLLVENEANAIIDKNALRDAGVARVCVMTSGIQAARLLIAKLKNEEPMPVDIIFCHTHLADMPVRRWVQLMRKHPRFSTLPILVIVGSSREAEQVKALAMGFDDLIVRPYSRQSLSHNLQQLSIHRRTRQKLSGTVDAVALDNALRQLDACKSEEEEAHAFFAEGLHALQQRQWKEAIRAFNKALSHFALKGEAELGLATVWRGKGNLKKYAYYLNEASLTFIRADKWNKARTAYARLLSVAPESPSPFLQMAEIYIRAARYEEAAEALVAGVNLGDTQNMSKRIANTCVYMNNPVEALHKVQNVLEKTPLQSMNAMLEADLQEALDDRAVRQKRREERALKAAMDTDAQNNKRAYAVTTPSDFVSRESLVDDMLGVPSLLEEDTAQDTNDATLNIFYVDNTAQNRKKSVANTFHEDDAKTGFFAAYPKLNEMATIVKFTWKFMRHKSLD